MLSKCLIKMATRKTAEDEKAPHTMPGQDPLGPSVRLTQALSMSDVTSESGTVFEVDLEEEKNHQQQQHHQTNFFDDPSLIASLTLGANMFEDEGNSNDEDENEEPFEKLAKRMEDMTDDGGVLKMEMRAGIGGHIPNGASVTFHYTAFLEHHDEPFDSTHLRGRPEKKVVGRGELLLGLDIAIQTMRKGEIARFLIKPQYAFGEIGCPPRIPGGETLLYEVHVLSVVDSAAADFYEDLDDQEQNASTFQEKLEAAKAYHRQGNQHYHEGNLTHARSTYFRAAWIMENTALKDCTEEAERGAVLVKLRSNLAQVYLELKEPARACTQCKLGLSVTGSHSQDIIAKLHFRYGKAKAMLNHFSDAQKHLLEAKRLKPNWTDATEELKALLQRKEMWTARERFMCQRMFRSNSSTGLPVQAPKHNTQVSGRDQGTKQKKLGL